MNTERKPVVVGLGEILWDLLPEGRQLGGAPANFAYHCHALGAEGLVVSAVGEDEDGIDEVIYPKLSFTRLAIRDNSETFDALFNLYQKGSLPIDIIFDLLNIDPVTAHRKLEEDLFTLKDATFNEVLRSVYGRVGDALAENSDAADVIADRLGLKYEKPKEEGSGRFS